MRFEDKVALVAGGRSGIDRAIARRLRDEGANVITAQRGEDTEFGASRRIWPIHKRRSGSWPRS